MTLLQVWKSTEFYMSLKVTLFSSQRKAAWYYNQNQSLMDAVTIQTTLEGCCYCNKDKYSLSLVCLSLMRGIRSNSKHIVYQLLTNENLVRFFFFCLLGHREKLHGITIKTYPWWMLLLQRRQIHFDAYLFPSNEL